MAGHYHDFHYIIRPNHGKPCEICKKPLCATRFTESSTGQTFFCMLPQGHVGPHANSEYEPDPPSTIDPKFLTTIAPGEFGEELMP
jgi:hypothetical protein